MPKPVLKYTSHINGDHLVYEIYTNSHFSKLSNVKQVYGFVLNHLNKILLVSGKNSIWTPAGGTVEAGESLTDTLKREIYEESAITIDESSIKPFFYQKVFNIDNNQYNLIATQVRYFCRPKKIEKFINDPDNYKITKQVFVDIKDIGDYLKWGAIIPFIQKEILKFI